MVASPPKIRVNWALSVQVVDGPKILENQPSLEVDAYDRIDVVAPKHDGQNPGTLTVDVQPGAVDKVHLILIKSDLYSESLTYKGAGGSDPAKPIKLDAVQFLLGAGAVGLLGNPPTKLEFTNAKTNPAQDANITILIGRKAS